MALNLNLREQLTKLVTGTLPPEAQSRADAEDKAAAEKDLKKQVDEWTEELQLAENFLNDWRKDGNTTVDAYLDEGKSDDLKRRYRLNLFHANIQTLMAIMFARMPKVEADRRFADPSDDDARVASEMLTRILQNDMNDPEDKLMQVLRQALQDRLLPGLGAARVRYNMTEKDAPVEGVEYDDANPVPKVKDKEHCDMVYVHWRDILYSPCRTAGELRWKAYRSYLTKAEMLARFGKEIAEHVPYASRGPSLDPEQGKASEFTTHEKASQAEVWEIWDLTTKCVYWYVKGFDRFLDKQEDPMQLEGFFPDAPMMIANVTTKKYLPKPDYFLAKDLYDEIHELEGRLGLLTRACKAVGVYPSSAEEIKRLLTEGVENRMIPVENWAVFADKGGLKGQIDYFPVEQIANTITILTVRQQNLIQQLYQVTGMSDIIRGQAATAGVTATEQKIKAQFASTRMQFLQEEFANFASELLNKKVQLIRRYYEPEYILELSNVMNTPDAPLAQNAIALIKGPSGAFNCRVKIQADSMAQVDYEALKMERGEFLAAVAGFLGQSTPLLQAMPSAGPFLLELLKFSLAGYKASNTMEGVVDQAIAALVAAEQQKASQPPPPSPEEKAEQIKVQGQMQVEQVKAQATAQADAQRAQVEMQIKQQEMQLEMEKMRMEMEQDREKHKLEMMKLMMEIQAKKAELGMKREEMALKLDAKAQETALDLDAREQEHELNLEAQEQAAVHRDEEHAQKIELQGSQKKAEE